MEEGRADVALYVLNNTPQAVKAMQTCWEMVDAVENEKRESQSRLFWKKLKKRSVFLGVTENESVWHHKHWNGITAPKMNSGMRSKMP